METIFKIVLQLSIGFLTYIFFRQLSKNEDKFAFGWLAGIIYVAFCELIDHL